MRKSKGDFEKPRAALYSRVSTSDQDAAGALADLRRVARQRGYRVAMEVEEVASGAKGDRVGLAKIMEAARRGEVDALLVTRVDRLARSVLDLHQRVEMLVAAGVSLVVTEQPLEVGPGGSSTSQLILGVLGAVASFERSIIVERVREGLRRAKAKGVRLGRPRSQGPDGATVTKLRTQKRPRLSWAQVAERLDCTPSLARRRWEEHRAAPSRR